MIYQQQGMTSIRTQAYGVQAFKLTQTRLGISLSLSKVRQAKKIMLQNEETKRCDISSTTNDLISHPRIRCTRIQVDSCSNRNLSISL